MRLVRVDLRVVALPLVRPFRTSSSVKTHIQHILTKLGVHSRTQAVAFAHGVPPAEPAPAMLILVTPSEGPVEAEEQPESARIEARNRWQTARAELARDSRPFRHLSPEERREPAIKPAQPGALGAGRHGVRRLCPATRRGARAALRRARGR